MHDAEFRAKLVSNLRRRAQEIEGGGWFDDLKNAASSAFHTAVNVASNPTAQKLAIAALPLAKKALGLGKRRKVKAGASSGGASSGGARRRVKRAGAVSGGDMLGDIANIASIGMKVAPLFGLGKKGKRGGAKLTPYQQYLVSQGGAVSGGAMSGGGSFLDQIPLLGPILGSIGLGKAGKPKRKPSAHAAKVGAYMRAHKGVSLAEASRAVAGK